MTYESVAALRALYPTLSRSVSGRPIVYFDNAATSLKPLPVIDEITRFLSVNGANVHRGVHFLSQEASDEFERARESIAAFVGADQDEIVFVRNTTEGINLVAGSLSEGSRVLVTGMEHHSNLLPWRNRHEVRVVPIRADGTLEVGALFEEIEKGIDLVAICHVSNVFGVVNPIDDVIQTCHEHGAQVLVDGAQAAPHLALDVQSTNCDYYAFSGHKLGAPTGIGVLYGKRENLEMLRPLNRGGNTVTAVHLKGETMQSVPLRFEAGTPNVEGALALAKACDFLDEIGLNRIWDHDRALTAYARDRLEKIPRVKVFGPNLPADLGSIVTFNVGGVPANTVAKILSDRGNIFVRSGHLCCQPLHELLEIDPCVRASFYLYNTEEEVDAMVSILAEVVKAVRG